MKVKRFFVLAAIAASLLITANAKEPFVKSNTYSADLFSDVLTSAWYADSVKSAYEFGIMSGKGEGVFDPEGTLTVAEGVTVAARIHAAFTGNTVQDADGEWYDKFISYAEENDLLGNNVFEDYNRNIRRFEMAELLHAASSELGGLNEVYILPDVSQGVPYQKAVLQLYQAGILTGNDEYGTFAPQSNLLRSELCAMTVRIADPEKRVKKEFLPLPGKQLSDAYAIIEAPAHTGRNGLANGWNYDNRFDLLNHTGTDKTTLVDADDENFYSLIRDFKPESEGLLRLELLVEVCGNDRGVSLALQDENLQTSLELTPENGKWVFVGTDKTVTPIEVPEETPKFYAIEMQIDLDQHIASVVINNTACGSITIPDTSLSRLVLGTNKVGTGTVSMKYARLFKNYAVNHHFLADNANLGQKPVDWDVTGDFRLQTIASMKINDLTSVKAESKAGSVSTAVHHFAPVAGKVAFETMILLPVKTDGVSVSLMSGDTEAVKFETRDGKLYVGSHMVNDYLPNVWQTLHVEADTASKTADIYVNGKNKVKIPLEVQSFDTVNIAFAPTKEAVMWFDDVEVYCVPEHSDYPAKPHVAVSDDYNIGINVCWLWRDAQSGEGWDSVSPFEEFDPYLGFYDEGLRETADWELKWMAEHGIDFIHACWYAPTGDVRAPIKEMRHSYAALHDGYMMAKYSDLVDFCIMWENGGKDCSSFDQFKEYIWKYWVEYYFSDPRYARLDNKAVLTVWSKDNFLSSFGGENGARDAIAFMDKEVRKLGYDGIIVLASTQGANPSGAYVSLSEIGYEATYGYHWGTKGYDPEHQIHANRTNVQNAAGLSHHIPTVSIGFNNIGRGETRHPIITAADHLRVCEDVKDILDNSHTGTWKDNTLFVSTWNEYSEGTYVFPTASNGFSYLENIRKTFTEDTSDHSNLDIMPSADQIARVTHLYPPHHAPIRRYHFETADAQNKTLPENPNVPVIKVNGTRLGFTFAPVALADGDAEVVGEARKLGFYSALRVYHEWDRFTGNGVLTLKTRDERTLVFSVGSDKVMVDGKEMPLGFTFRLRDGLPVFHIQKLCKLLGYTYTTDGNTISIQAASKEENAIINANVPNNWEFELSGETEGWDGQNCTLSASDGFLHMAPSGADVAVKHSVSFEESEYTHVVIGLSYDEQLLKQTPQLFFTTQTSTNYSGDKCFNSSYKPSEESEDILEATFDLSANHLFVGKITGLRIDPYHGTFPAKIAYIRCYNDPNAPKAGSDLVEVDDENQWYFDKDGDLEGWTSWNVSDLNVVHGCLSGVGTNSDPSVHTQVDFGADEYQYLVVGIRYSAHLDSVSPALYFTSVQSPKWEGNKMIAGSYAIPYDTKPGDLIEVRFNLNQNSLWKGDITAIRFDMFSSPSPFEIEHIRLYKKAVN